MTTVELKRELTALGVKEDAHADELIVKLKDSSEKSRKQQMEIAKEHTEKLTVLASVEVQKVDKDALEGYGLKTNVWKMFTIVVKSGDVQPAIERFAISPKVHSDHVIAHVLTDGRIEIAFEVPDVSPKNPYKVAYNFVEDQVPTTISLEEFQTPYQVTSQDRDSIMFRCRKGPAWNSATLKQFFKSVVK